MSDIVIILAVIVGACVLGSMLINPSKGDLRALMSMPYGGYDHRAGPPGGYSSALDDVRWDGTPYTRPDNSANWTGRTLREIHVPTIPGKEDAMRAFYFGTLGMIPMRHPEGADAKDGFWAMSGTRQVHFARHARFTPEPGEMPAFIIPALDTLAARLVEQGHYLMWDDSLAYVRRAILTDPAGNEIALIGA